MKGTFISNFLAEAKGKTTTVLKSKLNSTNILSNLCAGGNKLKSVLSVRVSAYDNLINGFLQDSEMVADKWADTAVFTADDYQQYQSEISDEVANNLIATIREFGQIGGEMGAPSDTSVIICDGNGFSYLLDTKPKVYNGCDVLISNTNNGLTDMRQAVLYRDLSGKLVFNNIMFSQYWPFQSQAATTILDKVVSINVELGVSVATTIRENLWNLCSSLELNPVDDNITSYLVSLCSHYELQSTGKVSDDVSLLYNKVISVAPVFTKYAANSIWDIMSDVIATNEMNSMFAKALDAVGSNHTIANITAVIQDAIVSKYQSVRDTARRLVEAFNSGGFAGVVAFIASFLDKGSSVSNNDGQLEFTDNNALIPRQYIATMVSTVVTSIASIAGLLVSIFSIPIGMALSALASMAKGIINSITYDYSSTRPALFDSEDVAFNVVPYGMLQHEFPAAYLSPEIRQILMEQMNVVSVETVGGCLFIGAGSFNEDGSIKTARCEFHASLEPHFEALHEIQRKYIMPFAPLVVETEKVGTSAPNVYAWHWRLKNLPPALLLNPNLIMDVYDQYNDEVLSAPLANESNGYLSESNSALLNNIVVVNTALFALYYSCLCGVLPYSDDTAQYADDVWIYQGYVINAQVKFRNLMAFGLFVDSTLSWQSGGDVVTMTIPRLTGQGTGQGWSNLSTNVASHMSSDAFGPSDNFGIINFFRKTGWYDYPVGVPSSFKYGVKLPSYDASTFLLWIVAAAVVTAAIAVTTAVLTVKARKAINQKRAKNNAAVENAWNDFSVNPTPENYKAYRKTVKKNNLWVKFIGGTKYDTNNYWNGDVRDGSEASTSPSVSKFAATLGNSEDEATASENTVTRLADISEQGVSIMGELSDTQLAIASIIESSTLSTGAKIDAIRALIIGPQSV